MPENRLTPEPFLAASADPNTALCLQAFSTEGERSTQILLKGGLGLSRGDCNRGIAQCAEGFYPCAQPNTGSWDESESEVTVPGRRYYKETSVLSPVFWVKKENREDSMAKRDQKEKAKQMQ